MLVCADRVASSCALHVPVQGADKFQGKQLHAKQFTDASIATGKRVVVIGAGKSALDRASEIASSRTAASVTWLFRQVS
jgi:dimethylaniline monooxygenase (N-oxide forming)